MYDVNVKNECMVVLNSIRAINTVQTLLTTLRLNTRKADQSFLVLSITPQIIQKDVLLFMYAMDGVIVMKILYRTICSNYVRYFTCTIF